MSWLSGVAQNSLWPTVRTQSILAFIVLKLSLYGFWEFFFFNIYDFGKVTCQIYDIFYK